jgi:hypothetical protein
MICGISSLDSDSSPWFSGWALGFWNHLHDLWDQLFGFRFIALIFGMGSLFLKPSSWFAGSALWFQIRLLDVQDQVFIWESVSVIFGKSSNGTKNGTAFPGRTWFCPMMVESPFNSNPWRKQMKLKMFRTVCFLACIAMAIPMLAFQKGDPLTGTWTGDWGPNAGDRNSVSVEMKLDGKTLTGTVHSINFQRADVMLQKSTFDAATGAVHMEAEVPGQRGGPVVHFVIDGKLAGGSMSGSWNHGTTKGDFKLTKK